MTNTDPTASNAAPTEQATATADELVAAHEAETLDENPDPAIAALQKCKPAKHLRVIIEQIVGHAVADTGVRYIPVLSCRNPDEGPNPTWGALIYPTSGKAQGMQLFPDAVSLLADQLPIVADEARAKGADWNVSLQHTVRKVFTTWRTFIPDSADTIGAELAALPPA